LIAFLAAAVLMSTMTGCAKRGLVKINGEKVSKDDFYARLERVTVQMPQGAQPAGRYVIQQIITEKLVQQLAKEHNVAPTDAQINKKIEFAKKQSGGDLRKVLAQRGMTLDDLKHQIALEQSFINVVTKGAKIPDADVQKAYNDALKAPNSPFVRPENVFVSAILTNTKAKADKAYSLLTGGQDFGTVAMQMSDEPTFRQNQGKLNWVAKNDQRVPAPIRNAAFVLAIGKFSKPILVTGKWLIVRADQKRPAKITQLAEVKDMMAEQMAVKKGSVGNKMQKEMAAFIKKSDIVVNAERYRDIPEQLKRSSAGPTPVPGGAAPSSGAPGPQATTPAKPKK